MIWGEVLRFISTLQTNLYKKYSFRYLELSFQVCKSLTLFLAFPPSLLPHNTVTYAGWILLYNFVKKKKECCTHLPAFFVCWSKLTAFFVFAGLSEAYQNV